MNRLDSLRLFFDRYAELSQSPAPEPLAALYAPHFIVGGPQGSSSFTNDAKFLDWLRQVHTFNVSHGMRALEVVSIHEQELSPVHALATVRWGTRFEKTGDRRIEFDIVYLLEKSGDGWKILTYISPRDQEEAMKQEGLL